jgi:atypical dual specificity phosphatase
MHHIVRALLHTLRMRSDLGSWVLPDQVLACAYPHGDAGLAALAERGIRSIVNLETRAHAPAALARHGLTEVHLPTKDFSAPSLASLRTGVAAIEDALASGRRVAVHCGAGLGRTGTLLACLLVHRGAAPDDAIAEVRRRRPGSIETEGQEAIVHDFAAAMRG